MMWIQKELLNDSHTEQPFTHPNQEAALTAEKGKEFNVDDDNGDKIALLQRKLWVGKKQNFSYR